MALRRLPTVLPHLSGGRLHPSPAIPRRSLAQAMAPTLCLQLRRTPDLSGSKLPALWAAARHIRRLIERANDHTLHPAQCRWTIGTPTRKRKSRACGGRLDQRVATDPYRRPHPTSDILRFQQSLLARLEPLTPASDASEYFTDLRLATALIATTWPVGQHLLDTTFTGHVAAYVHSASGNSSTSNDLQHSRLRDVPPRDPIACAGLRRAAHALLEADDLSEHLSHIVHTPGNGRHVRPGYASTPDMKTRAHRDSETQPNP